MLYYGLVCTAITKDRQDLRDGTRLLANLAHKHNIPVTWAITSDTAQFLAKDLTEWHTEFGDELLLMLNIKTVWNKHWSALTGQSETDSEDIDNGDIIETEEIIASSEIVAEQLVNMREVLPKYIRTEWKKIAHAMNWVEPSIVGSEWKHQLLVNALELTGFKGLWGYQYDARGTDAEADRGCPFGYFYPSEEQHNFSTPAAGSIAAIPYHSTSHLLKTEMSLRASLIGDRIQDFYDIYSENQRWNRWLSFVEHVNLLDVKLLGQESLEKLDAYFEHVSNSDGSDVTKVLPLSEIVDDYWTNCQQTEPTFIVADIPDAEVASSTDSEDPSVTVEINNGENSDNKKLFHYYDAECQFTFVEGEMEPTQMNNYISPPIIESQGRDSLHDYGSSHGIEFHLPKISGFRPIRKRSRLHIVFSVESTKSMPYGIAVWGNHLGLQLESTNTEGVNWVDKHLLFIRLALEQGNNEFEVVLTI